MDLLQYFFLIFIKKIPIESIYIFMATSVLSPQASRYKNDLSNSCIICLKKTGTLTSTENRRRNMEAAKVCDDEVQKRLYSVQLGTHFKYHINYKCYKSYTRRDFRKNQM